MIVKCKQLKSTSYSFSRNCRIKSFIKENFDS